MANKCHSGQACVIPAHAGIQDLFRARFIDRNDKYPMKYNKLVRDKIPEYIKTKGGTPRTHIADEAEYWRKLKEKLIEETGEFVEAENIEELADLLEVIEAIIFVKKFDQVELARMKDKKAAERGKFIERIVLDES